MYQIIVKREASTDYPNKEELNGIDCQDNFAEYFDKDFTFKNSIEYGYMDFRFEDGKLWTYTIYNSDRELRKEELELLKDYTEGQWSDGIGEGFEQEPCKYSDEDEEIFISPWSHNQKVTIEQKELKTA